MARILVADDERSMREFLEILLVKEGHEVVLAESVPRSIDLAVSLDMQVDHGAVQPMEILFGDITAKPFVPVFVNSVAPPFTPLQRVRLLGEAIGRYLADLDQKVLLIASGGLSHDPPVPRLATANDAMAAAVVTARKQNLLDMLPPWGNGIGAAGLRAHR